MTQLNDVIIENMLLIGILLVTCVIAGILICVAVRTRSEVEREAAVVLAKRREDVETAASDLSEQSAKLQRGLRRVSDSVDPLQAFIDALDTVKRRDRGNRK